jgi:predicted transcriptional regulator
MTLERFVLGVLAQMPKDATIDDFISELELERDLEEAEADVEAGRVHTQEEVEKMVAEWTARWRQ